MMKMSSTKGLLKCIYHLPNDSLHRVVYLIVYIQSQNIIFYDPTEDHPYECREKYNFNLEFIEKYGVEVEIFVLKTNSTVTDKESEHYHN